VVPMVDESVKLGKKEKCVEHSNVMNECGMLLTLAFS
jgi:hypothetical protein